MLNATTDESIGVLPESRLSTAFTSVVIRGTRSAVLMLRGAGAPVDSTPLASAV